MTATLDTTPCPSPWWLPDRQSQTLYGALAAHTHRVRFVRDRVDTPDGDFLDFDWTATTLTAQPVSTIPNQDPMLASGAASRWMQQADHPLLGNLSNVRALVLLHGLEGSSRSRYAQSIAQHFRARGWVVVIAHFRGCSGAPNRLARAYYSGDSEEVGFILDTVRARVPGATWHAAGVSLGGNALLKFLGEHPARADWLAGAAGISVPLDLVAAGMHLSEGAFNRNVYSRYFLNTLKPKVLEKANRFPGAIDVHRVSQARSLRDFDDAYTAPMHGFRDAQDYWSHCSSRPWLRSIATRTLVLNARNDPFLPEAALPGPQLAARQVLLHQPATGGHAGFVTGPFPGHLGWLPGRLGTFFDSGR